MKNDNKQVVFALLAPSKIGNNVETNKLCRILDNKVVVDSQNTPLELLLTNSSGILLDFNGTDYKYADGRLTPVGTRLNVPPLADYSKSGKSDWLEDVNDSLTERSSSVIDIVTNAINIINDNLSEAETYMSATMTRSDYQVSVSEVPQAIVFHGYTFHNALTDKFKVPGDNVTCEGDNVHKALDIVLLYEQYAHVSLFNYDYAIEEQEDRVLSLSVTPTEIDMFTDETFTLSVIPMLDGAPTNEAMVTIESKNVDVVTIDSGSIVTPVSEGSASIIVTASFDEQEIIREVDVTVTETVFTLQDLRITTDEPIVGTTVLGSAKLMRNGVLFNDTIEFRSDNASVSLTPGTIPNDFKAKFNSDVKANITASYGSVAESIEVKAEIVSIETDWTDDKLEITESQDTTSINARLLYGRVQKPGTQLSYVSNDNSVATVSDTGIVTVVSHGSATITVSGSYGGVNVNKVLSLTVTEEVYDAELTLNPTEILEGETSQATMTVTLNGEEQMITPTFSTNDQSGTVTVDASTGLVTASDAITANRFIVITGTAVVNGKTLTANAELNVKQVSYDVVVTVEPTEIFEGEEAQATMSVKLDGVEQSFTPAFSTTDTGINISVDDVSGLIIAAHGLHNDAVVPVTGTAVVNGKTVSSTTQITVKQNVVYDAELTIEPTEIFEGETSQATMIVTRNGSPVAATVTYSSDDVSVSVDAETGVITGVASDICNVIGTAIVDGETVTASAEITVLPNVYGVLLELANGGTSVGLSETGNLVVSVTKNGESFAPDDITFESSDSDIISVDATGLIEGISEGTATITVSSVSSFGDETITLICE